ncbi:hypothetical protein NMB32_21330 [Stenotrophomonas sp. CD2]|nr:hypothetical protein NMB32_21330 [Stenotrophomonas sp. CD2]
MRWTSALASALLHLLFFMLLLWVAVIRTTAPEAEGAEGERVQVEFVGRASQEGGGDQPGAEAAAAAPAGLPPAGKRGLRLHLSRVLRPRRRLRPHRFQHRQPACRRHRPKPSRPRLRPRPRRRCRPPKWRRPARIS